MSAASGEGECTLDFRPHTDEVAFAPVGAALKVADRHCINDYLIIPFKQISRAVTLPPGEYKATGGDHKELLFTLDNGAGAQVNSCPWCDPLRALKIDRAEQSTLCVISKLNVESCAAPNRLTYMITKKESQEDGLCTPGLVYSGRQGSILHFAVSDCQSTTGPTLSYDLSLGNVIRFLDEQITILSADNEGISFKRMPPPPRRINEI
ncbi:MAG: hypothetical protein IJ228_10555 [Succinivibrio sp.]|nr:hypothetical protein [Succinivibrio sp.]